MIVCTVLPYSNSLYFSLSRSYSRAVVAAAEASRHTCTTVSLVVLGWLNVILRRRWLY